MKMRTCMAMATSDLLLVLCLLGQTPNLAAGQSPSDVEGVWRADRYSLADGPDYEVRGRIFFSEADWQVLFFVMDDQGNPRRASGEGGTYERTSDGVVFRHLFHLSVGDAMPGLAEAPIRIEARGAEDEPRRH